MPVGTTSSYFPSIGAKARPAAARNDARNVEEVSKMLHHPLRRPLTAIAAAMACIAAVLTGATMPETAEATPKPVLRTRTWTPAEITLNSTVSYPDSYRDVDVSATFTGPNGQTLTAPGFWDGGTTWRIRFSPPVSGRWQYSTRSSDSANTGLNRQQGTILAADYAGGLDIYRHGFLRSSANNRYVTYADGKPFFWLGDNEQSALAGTKLNESNDPRFASQFKGIVDTRATQGFNVIWTETFANNGRPSNEGGPAWLDSTFGTLNPGFWQSVDQRIDYIAAKGIVTALAMGVGSSLTDSTKGQTPEYVRLARYMAARYAAYPVVWLTAQEFDQPANCISCWQQVAKAFHDADPYRNLTSLHQFPIFAGGGVEFRNETWYGFVALQEGHNRVDSVTDYWLKEYALSPARPVVEAEANYEGIDVFWDNHAIVQTWQTRESAWKARVGGVAGSQYGAAGVWWTCWDAQSTDTNCQLFGSTPWYEGLFLPGAEQMGHLKSFFTSLRWWELAPAPDAITWAGDAPTGSQQAFASSNPRRSTTVVYYPHRLDGGQAYGGTLIGLPNGAYQLSWFDPRTGRYRAAGSVTVTRGNTALPPQPSAGDDWVLLIRASARQL
ncbi:DUF4038 domain-containing protein [Kribbella sp. NPDC050124]|uniref:apiosidase-like domain-containing protein n=1 Tax=Kribbella sp. NPDC050124 TaxID=3364114 RepID=UPI00378EA078